MKVLLVSTWKQHCGIATYTQDLVRALQEMEGGPEVFVAAERIKQDFNEKLPNNVFRVWDRRSFMPNDILHLVNTLKPDILHIQHEFGLFPREKEFFEFIAAARVLKVPVHITLHTVAAPPARWNFHRILSMQGVRVLVHSKEAALALSTEIDAKVIPHGIWYNPQARGQDNLLVPGFVSPSKNHEEIMLGYAHALCRYGNLPKLKISGLCGDFNYEAKLRDYGAKLGLNNYLEFSLGWHESLETTGTNAVILGNKGGSPYSASGQLATAVGMGLPVVAKNVPIYLGTEGVVYYKDAEELGLFLNPKLLTRAPMPVNRFWENVAKAHVNWYNS